MYSDYADIRTRIADPPTWFDQDGVPRYGAYYPACSSIYAKEAALFEIACQGCKRRALVSLDLATWDIFRPEDHAPYARPTAATAGSFGYGDFPRWLGDDQSDCCGGVTMTTSVTRIVEFWIKGGDHFTWERHPEYEFIYPA